MAWTLIRFLGLCAWAAMGLGGALAHFSVIPPRVGFLMTLIAGVISLVAVCAIAYQLLLRRTFEADWTAYAATIPIIIIAIALLPAFRYPVINDVSTDVEDVPQFVHAPTLPETKGLAFAFPGENKEVILKNYPNARSLLLKMSASDAFTKTVDVLKKLPGVAITHQDQQTLVVEATATTRLFRFVDDVVVRLRKETDGVRVDVRSKSRVGKSDLGANAKRIETILALVTR